MSLITPRPALAYADPEPFTPHPCETCQGTGVLRCTCAGDGETCICERRSEYPCPECAQ